MKTAFFLSAMLVAAVAPHAHADDPAYQQIIGSWDGQWKSKTTGSTGNITFSCRRGSSLSPNCTAKITNADGSNTNTYEYSPDWKGNGKLVWKNGPFDYVFQLRKDGTLLVTYKVRKDSGTWTLIRR